TATVRQRDTEVFAARESERASRLRTELAERSVELEALRRDLAATRTTEAGPGRRAEALAADLATAQATTERTREQLAIAAATHATEREALRSDNERQATILSDLRAEIAALHQAEVEAAARAAA